MYTNLAKYKNIKKKFHTSISQDVVMCYPGTF